ncbi:uncharacterized protein LOC129981395 [Argiope bruennichi]|uniref:uncharacterized protein LOC129959915 n=1 Tax=Argiope bruennichi TaxID=94029 RepID=UPI002495342C|nr:uncharacterized protein LOC129959915 [Argiope bruennichi]XP_055931606.1 uncharacterized protein LOC129961975 [Argiope bruennichi]XP_055948201.1 uncharacterized protein LOC129981395 [Argiope bruennichi]
MRSGDLLVEINTKKQAQQIIKLKALADIPVSVNSHTSLNFSKGVITCGELFNVSLEEISHELKPQGVTQVRQITIRREGQILPTKHYILTFHSPNIPEYIYAGHIKLPVRPYIPNPLRCYQCQRYGHSKVNCRGTLTCARCAEKGPDSQLCTAKEKCVNCGGDHPSYARSCPRWNLEKQVTSLKIKENLSYPEARRRVQTQTPTPGVSYASVVQKSFCINCSCENCMKQTTKTKPPAKTSESDSENSVKSLPESPKPDLSTSKKIRKKKPQSSLTLKLAKRGLSHKDLSSKLQKSTSRNSVALGLAKDGIAHKDLTSIFGGKPTIPDFKLHPSEDEDALDMSCEDQATPINGHSLSFSKPRS